MQSEKLQIHVLQLKPGQDLRSEIELYVQKENIKAGWIITCVGSLTQTHIRFANQSKDITATGHFEIVSLTGTVSTNGCHLHLSVSDGLGRCTGGHLLFENLIYTTAEIIIGATKDLIFTREHDIETGWKELRIIKRASGKIKKA